MCAPCRYACCVSARLEGCLCADCAYPECWDIDYYLDKYAEEEDEHD